MKELDTPIAVILQDVILLLEHDPCPLHDELLRVAKLIKDYFNKPSNEITLQAIKEGPRYFRLYLWFLRLPEDEIASIFPEAQLLIVKADAYERLRARLPIQGPNAVAL